MTYKVWYHCSGCIDIEADSESEALEQFDELSEHTLLDNSFGWNRDDIEEN